MKTRQGAKGHSFVPCLCPLSISFSDPKEHSTAMALLAVRGGTSSEHESHNGILSGLLRGCYRLRVDLEGRTH